ncbi:MAG: GIDE domain-containing protein [Myxococcota bacterium]
MPIVSTLIVVGLFVLIGAWWFSETQRIKRALRGAEMVQIAQYPHGGLKRIVGKLSMNEEPLVAPLTGRPCAAYEVVLEQLRSSGKSSSWHTVFREIEVRPFTLDDGTGRAFVEPSEAKLVITRDERSQSGTFDDPTPREQAFLDMYGQSGEGWVFNKTLRYSEGVLEPGEDVAVLGRGAVSFDDRPAQDPHAGGYRQGSQSTKVTLRAGPKDPLYISDDPSTLY